MTLEDLKNYYKGAYDFEKRTGMSHTTYYYWFNRYKCIPLDSQLKLETITGGALKADLKHVRRLGEWKEKREKLC